MVLTIEAETESSPEQTLQLVNAIIDEGFLDLFSSNLHRLSFESRKDTQVILSSVFRFRPEAASDHDLPPALEYVVTKRPQILVDLCMAYEHKESATPAGSVLREMLKHEPAARVILYEDSDEPGSSLRGIKAVDVMRPQTGNGVFWKFFEWIDKSSFEVAADAFTTFRVSLYLATLPRTLQALWALADRPARRFSPSTKISSLGI